MYLNTMKALDLVNQLEMVKGNNDIFNNFELKFLRAQEEDKVYERRMRAMKDAQEKAASRQFGTDDEYQLDAELQASDA